MAFLIGPMQHKIKGQKEYTEKNEIIHLDINQVEISTLVGTHLCTPCVKVGDEVKIGTLIAKREDKMYVPIFSSVSGKVVAIEKKMSTSLKPVDYIIIENNHKDDKEQFSEISLKSSREQIINFMKEIGLVGQGGAGFPTYIKYSTDKCETLIINAIECEPFITSDIRNIENNLDDFIDGVKLMYRVSHAKESYVCIKETHKELASKLIDLFADEHFINVKICKDVYPMGWERTLTYTVLNKRYDKLPIEVGAIVSNATSLITLAKTIKNRTYVYERIVTVSGDNVKEPHNVMCRIGTPISKLLEVCGGVVKSPANIIVGGPMMGKCVTKEEVSITSIVNAITIFEEKKYREYSCLRCGRCVEHCPSSLEPVSIMEAYKFTDVDRLVHLHAKDCVECGMCTFICPSKIEVTENIRRAKQLLALKGK